ncbi:uncharacterized protein LOC143859416 [Tasmannia lanceolata]|uniref:uncharacterized protein LOC143859416 n=1 Tax=Tasmannia lanceolata TaxID=3420 RepID=UPI0040638D03
MGRILVDTESSVNVLHQNAFAEMGINNDRLEPVNWFIFGFSGGEVKVRGKIKLPVTFGTHPNQRTIMQTFVVVHVPSTYNGIIGRPALNELGAVVSTAHLKIKFPTKLGVREVIDDQEKAHECYAALLKKKKAAKETSIGGTDPRVEVKQGEPVEELTKIPLFPGIEGQTVQIGSLLSGKLRTELVNFLKANPDVFAWSASDMQGIPSDVAVHKLNVDPNSKPVKQKKRSFAAAERQKHIREEIDKLLDTKFVREIRYPEWLANVVMVKKSNGKWRICIDFTDLNKAAPKIVTHYRGSITSLTPQLDMRS